MAEYIKKDDIGLTDFEIASYAPDYRAVLKAILTKIDDAPTLDIIQCRDCVYWVDNHCDLHHTDAYSFEYCSGAELKRKVERRCH